ncbi:hypothetical protein AAHH97_03785 [Mycolicibacterium elephantis]|uniref:hypothetical protein n=1 Tax=Mycolicibacterium elephantis TaxID=81858 RepID=UPI0007EB676A|nr:hypothetical protein [Mycolicibacterium elephantis]OBE93712.1 hypothetical protein A5776_03930 [Mycolicibacterium elephantis]
MTTNEPTDSLFAALSKAHVPVENHEFIRQLMAAVGIAAYRAVERSDRSYVVATRRDGLPDLHIYYGYTNGFTSKEEIVRAAGPGVSCAPSSRKGTWYVAHPVTKVHLGGERARNVRREGGMCDCGMQLSVTGVCAICD